MENQNPELNQVLERRMGNDKIIVESSDEDEDPQGIIGEQRIRRQEEDEAEAEIEDSDQTMEYILRGDKEKVRSISNLKEEDYRNLMQSMCWRVNLSRATEAMREMGISRKERRDIGVALQMMEENPIVFRFAFEMTLQKVQEEEVRRERGESVESR